jgi:hypothetical protein
MATARSRPLIESGPQAAPPRGVVLVCLMALVIVTGRLRKSAGRGLYALATVFRDGQGVQSEAAAHSMSHRRRRFQALAVSVVLIIGGVVALVTAWSNDRPRAGTSPDAAIAPEDTTRPGSLVAADSLANTRIGGPYGTALAFRFRAGWTGTVRAVRFYVIVNNRARRGYSGGTWGSLRVALTRDSGTARHRPRGRALAAAIVRPSRDNLWPLVRFAKPARVVAGRLYHVVFTNVGPDPRRNYVSINALLAHGHGESRPRVPGGLAVLLGETTDGGTTVLVWRPRAQSDGERYVPILDVAGGDPGQHLGIGYMEVWVSAPRPIGGDAEVRQLLSVADGRTTTITGAWLRVQRADRAAAPLELRLERMDGARLAAASVPAAAISTRSPQWVHVRFAHPVAVPARTALALTASAAHTGSYETFPLRKGTDFGFDSRTQFAGGYAQYSDGGRWTGWTQWDEQDRHDSDLQFALDIQR